MTSKGKLLPVALLVLAQGYHSNLEAATAQTTLAIAATVLTTCIVVAVPVAFLNDYDPVAPTASTGLGTLNITCTSGAGYDIGLGAGQGSGATVTNRKMTRVLDGSTTLNYGLFQDASYSVNWGDTVGVDTLHKTGSGILVGVPVYARIPANQTVPGLLYTDTVQVTITY